jgi:hypothetical protein
MPRTWRRRPARARTRTLGLCLNERAPFGLIDFFIDALEREHDRSNSELLGDTGASVP